MITVGKVAHIPGAEQWADRICTQLGKTVESILEVGRLLIKAKAALPHGEFGRLFHEGLVPFTQNTADRLMAIAKHPALSNSAHAQNLPSSWMTLYELTKADPAILRAALKDGSIKPDMTRREIRALLPPMKARCSTLKSRANGSEYRTAGSHLYFQIARLLSDEFEELEPSDQDYLLTMLEQTISELRTNRGKEMSRNE